MKPSDGGRGVELRKGNVRVRWFSARHGYAGAWVGRHWMTLRWFAGFGIRNTGNVFGVYVYRDEDGDLGIDFGLWFVAWEFSHMAKDKPTKPEGTDVDG